MASKSIRESKLYSFREQFEKVLDNVPKNLSLYQWHVAIKEVNLLMEAKILQGIGEGTISLGSMPTTMMGNMMGNMPPTLTYGGGGHGTPIINVVVAPVISTDPKK